jgi:hypothetical protein
MAGAWDNFWNWFFSRGTLDDAFRIFVIAFVTLGFIYWSGRLLGIFKNDRQKNTAAAIMLLVHSYIVEEIFWASTKWYETLWDTYVYGMFGAIFYVVFCWRFFDRMDYWMDHNKFKDKGHRKKS